RVGRRDQPQCDRGLRAPTAPQARGRRHPHRDGSRPRLLPRAAARTRAADVKPSDQPPSVFDDLLSTRETPNRAALPSRRARARAGRRERQESTEQRSLFGEILDWMFAPLLLLWPLSVAVTFLVARSLADAPFDRSLTDRTLVLVEHVRSVASAPPAEPLAVTANHLLQDNDEEKVFFQVLDLDESLLAGDADLPRPRLYDF